MVMFPKHILVRVWSAVSEAMSIADGRAFNESCIQDPAKGVEQALNEQALSVVTDRHHNHDAATSLNSNPNAPISYDPSETSEGSLTSEFRNESMGEDSTYVGPTLEKKKTRFLSPSLKHQRKKVLYRFLLTNFVLASFIITVLSIYWGATYRESHFLHKVNILTVIQDDPVDITPNLTQVLSSIVTEVPGTWHLYNSSEYQKKRNIDRAEIDKEILNQVHSQDFWMSLNVKPNATNSLYQSLLSSSERPFNFSSYFQVIYESGRDPNSMRSTILPCMQQLEGLYRHYVVTQYLPRILRGVNSTSVQTNLISASNVNFDYWDYRPFYNPAVLSPLQVGLIYCLILTFFQLGLYGPLHREMAQLLKPKSMIIYRICVSFCTYFIMSLFFCTLSAIFQIDFTLAFGKAGFVVYWMSTWLLMAALGGANENVATIVASYGPQYLGFWLMTWIVLNIAPSFYPMAIHSSFYRYGYMMPIHNGLDIFKVIFLNTSKNTMGRNYGVLCAWIVLNTSLFPFIMMFIGKRNEKRAKGAGTSQGS